MKYKTSYECLEEWNNEIKSLEMKNLLIKVYSFSCEVCLLIKVYVCSCKQIK